VLSVGGVEGVEVWGDYRKRKEREGKEEGGVGI